MNDLLARAVARLSSVVPASLQQAEARGWGRAGLAPVVANPRLMAAAACMFFGSGGLIGLILTFQPGLPDERVSIMRVLAVAPMICAALLVLFGHLVPAWKYHALNITGTTLVTLLIWLSAGCPVAAAMAAIYVFVPLDSYFFFRLRTATAYQIFGMVACLATAWPLRLVQLPVALSIDAVMVVAAVVVGWLVRGPRQRRTGRPHRAGQSARPGARRRRDPRAGDPDRAPVHRGLS